MNIYSIFLLILEIIVFIIFMGIKHSELFRMKIVRFLEKFAIKHKLKLEIKEPKISSTAFKVLFVCIIFTFFLTEKMILIIFLSLLALALPKTVIPFEKYLTIFEERKPTLKKYNFYLVFIFLLEVILLANVVLFVK